MNYSHRKLFQHSFFRDSLTYSRNQIKGHICTENKENIYQYCGKHLFTEVVQESDFIQATLLKKAYFN